MLLLHSESIPIESRDPERNALLHFCYCLPIESSRSTTILVGLVRSTPGPRPADDSVATKISIVRNSYQPAEPPEREALARSYYVVATLHVVRTLSTRVGLLVHTWHVLVLVEGTSRDSILIKGLPCKFE